MGQKRRYFVFTESMPNVGSWNGRYTGANRKAGKLIRFDVNKISHHKLWNQVQEKPKGFLYDFGDGWTARVSVSAIEGEPLAKKKRKEFQGCRYAWMCDSILENGEILKPEPREA